MSFLWSTSHCQRLTKDRHFIYAAQYGSYGSYGHLILTVSSYCLSSVTSEFCQLHPNSEYSQWEHLQAPGWFQQSHLQFLVLPSLKLFSEQGVQL